MKLKPEIEKEIQTQQEKQLKRIQKLLSGSDRKALIEFLQSGQAPGSKAFRKLKSNVQKSVLRLNLTSIEIIIKRVRNPISRFRYKMAKLTYENMLKSTDK
ncbi:MULTISPECIES: hypothetical protein [unclassified Oceanispirochaeta]|uniref:hypothetical protein n=1 Tax=unclassified Oceanispirochaeta TaxID=2635722 RepID=UPI000E08FDCD|nr:MULTISPECIES: hypothetical protein [unclassified Oceanispirochaeta]MBF9018687.1 hypothetical protein [Oceanispirochaeta sp. M2]NPD75138.1 hypothetical protein [Oceanispirochaeta sp. M1]RDG29024.1 hypothetical protein DV872_23870 [Oceanispirochaeta sp. M1]